MAQNYRMLKDHLTRNQTLDGRKKLLFRGFDFYGASGQ
jgi:hypothetical protein